MERYLITLSIGPIQDFIAAARRTRDLWFGSHLLSEISKAAAKYFHDSGAELIFPSPKNPDKDLEPKDDNVNAFNVSNKLLVVVKTNQPSTLVENAKIAAKTRWEEFSSDALQKLQLNKPDFQIRMNIWNKQIKDVLEFYAAWILFDNDQEYQTKRTRLDQLINARKNTRDFLASPINDEGHGLPKSSLDGLRETVLKKEIREEQKRKLGLSPGEQLGCPGLVKRLGGISDQFTPLSRIAIDPWLRGLGIDLSVLFPSMNDLIEDGIVSRVEGNKGKYDQFPYDGQLLYPFRIEVAPLQIQREKETSDKSVILKKLQRLNDDINKLDLYKQHGMPSPYLAILAADGDRMGEFLDSLTTVEQHKSVSIKLTQFATNVPEIVRKSKGHSIYAGGDDVLALVPLDKAIDCAKSLYECFDNTLCEVEGISTSTLPTLSVGIAIGHFMEPMGKLLDLARHAEKVAKGNKLPKDQQKNSLAIVMQPRSGAAITFRENWSNTPEIILQQWIDTHLRDLLSHQTAYDLREESRHLSWARNKSDVVKAETLRIIKRKRSEKGLLPIDNKLLETLCDRAAEKGLEIVSEELILTRRIADAFRQAKT